MKKWSEFDVKIFTSRWCKNVHYNWGYYTKIKYNQKRTIKFTQKSFFFTKEGFRQSNSGRLNDPREGYIQKIAGTYQSEETNNITGVDIIHLKSDCIYGSIVSGVWKLLLFNFWSDKPPGHKLNEEPSIELFKTTNKSVLSHITICLEDDDHKPVDFNGVTISSTCQLVKVWSYSFK